MQNLKQIAIGAAVAAAIIAGGAKTTCAAVLDSGANGFAIEEHAHIAATPDKVYAALIQPAKWWNSQHTFSQNAANLTLDAKAGGCLCEALPNGGSVEHLRVATAMPGKMLVLRGAMGPFRGEGVDGALTFTLTAKDGGTDLVLDNNVGGYMKGSFGQWPQAADGMLSDLVAHLKQYAEAAK